LGHDVELLAHCGHIDSIGVGRHTASISGRGDVHVSNTTSVGAAGTNKIRRIKRPASDWNFLNGPIVVGDRIDGMGFLPGRDRFKDGSVAYSVGA